MHPSHLFNTFCCTFTSKSYSVLCGLLNVGVGQVLGRVSQFAILITIFFYTHWLLYPGCHIPRVNLLLWPPHYVSRLLHPQVMRMSRLWHTSCACPGYDTRHAYVTPITPTRHTCVTPITHVMRMSWLWQQGHACVTESHQSRRSKGQRVPTQSDTLAHV